MVSLYRTDTHAIHRLILAIPTLWLALGGSAWAESVEHPVTPVHLDQGNYHFSVSTNAIQGGVEFHVIIMAQKDEFPSGASVSICAVMHWKNSSGNGAEIGAAEPRTPVTLKKDGRTWTVAFTASPELLKATNVCCVFTAVERSDPKKLPPSADFYEINLRDFLISQPGGIQGQASTQERDGLSSGYHVVTNAINRGHWDTLRRLSKPGMRANEYIKLWENSWKTGHAVRVGNQTGVDKTAELDGKLCTKYSFALEDESGRASRHALQVLVREQAGESEILDFWSFGW